MKRRTKIGIGLIVAPILMMVAIMFAYAIVNTLLTIGVGVEDNIVTNLSTIINEGGDNNYENGSTNDLVEWAPSSKDALKSIMNIVLFVLGMLAWIPILTLVPAGIYFIVTRNEKSEAKEGVNYAGFWKRLAVHLFDKLINVLVVPIFFSIYFYFTEGQTLGCKLFGIRIVNEKDGETPETGNLILRLLSKILSALPMCLGFLWIGFDDRKQGWHDKIAKTIVVEEKKYGAWITWLANVFLVGLNVLILAVFIGIYVTIIYYLLMGQGGLDEYTF